MTPRAKVYKFWSEELKRAKIEEFHCWNSWTRTQEGQWARESSEHYQARLSAARAQYYRALRWYNLLLEVFRGLVYELDISVVIIEEVEGKRQYVH